MVALAGSAMKELETLLRPDQLISGPEQLRTYECDGLTGRRVVPALVVLPESAAEVAGVVRMCAAHAIPLSPAAPGPACPAGPCRSPRGS